MASDKSFGKAMANYYNNTGSHPVEAMQAFLADVTPQGMEAMAQNFILFLDVVNAKTIAYKENPTANPVPESVQDIAKVFFEED